jgi:hypothetical protein
METSNYIWIRVYAQYIIFNCLGSTTRKKFTLLSEHTTEPPGHECCAFVCHVYLVGLLFISATIYMYTYTHKHMTLNLVYVSNEIDDLQEQNIIVALCFEK